LDRRRISESITRRIWQFSRWLCGGERQSIFESQMEDEHVRVLEVIHGRIPPMQLNDVHVEET
jgi:hypothetical protein